MLGDSLSDVRIVDFTQIAAGPVCTHILADLGADVIKVEAPEGELGRALSPFVAGQSLAFLALNGNKRSVALDLKDSAQREAALQLASSADVVVESFRPGVMQRLGLSYEDVRQRHPAVIYCSISAYGQQSAWKHKPGVDGALQAISGLMSITGLPGAPPSKVQVPVVDMVTGYTAAIGVLGALARRARGGVGQWIDVGMFASAIALQESSFASYFAERIVPLPIGSAAPYAAPNEAVRCADGWIMLAAYHPSRWEALCHVLELCELLSDPRFLDMSGRIAHRKELVALLEERMVRRTRSDWLERFEEVDIICAPINDYSEVVASPVFADADFTEQVYHPAAGDVTLTRTPFRAVGEMPAKRRPAPLVGEHTREVLQEMGVPAVWSPKG
ncbi:CaiB/BaiF CoA transferase family protein [Ottowia sp. VDI28]|uniref:CaiB/BaiF CoA transferase family protein n=1 Tax=Ottowia sp. VDI28 TaxID=3133968 RepID=UPI003C2BACD0